MEALEEVHGLGVVHRDLKPANVIVDEEVALQRRDGHRLRPVVEHALDVSLRDRPVGTVRYIAPEQAGLLGLDADERSDLYSAGVVLFECLAGRPPFQGETVGEVLRQHRDGPTAAAAQSGTGGAAPLDEVVQRPLRKIRATAINRHPPSSPTSP